MRQKLSALLLIFILTACGAKTPTPAPVVEASATIAPTQGPTSTPLPPLVVLLIPANLNEEESRAYQKAVYELAQPAGYRFQVLNSLSTAELDPSLKLVIALPPDPGILALAAAAPQAQFLTINIPGITPNANVSILGSASDPIVYQAFMAGYISAMVTEDYHTGVIIQQDSVTGAKIEAAYRTGVEFYCGLCNPWAGPFLEYPLSISVPVDAKENELPAYADLLARSKVETMFVEPSLALPSLLEYMTTNGISVVGTQTPQEELSGWVATIGLNYLEALKTAWADLINGNGGKVFPAPLAITDVNEEILTPGKLALAQKTLSDLLKSLINPGATP